MGLQARHHDTTHACLLGLFGCLCPGISLAVHPQVEAGRENEGSEGVAYGALDGVDGVKEGEQQSYQPHKQSCMQQQLLARQHFMPIAALRSACSEGALQYWYSTRQEVLTA